MRTFFFGICFLGMSLWVFAGDVYRIGEGDVVYLSSPTHAALKMKLLVDEKGDVHLPGFGVISIAGLYPKAASSRIKRILSPYYNDLRIVQILRVERKKYLWIRGWVKAPGRYHLLWKENLEELIAKAGGAKEGARLDQVWIQSPGKAPVPFNLLKYYISKKLPNSFVLERNATVFVSVKGTLPPEVGAKDLAFSKNTFKISVFGAVKTPGVFPCFYSVDLLQALSLSGGVNKDASLYEVLYTTQDGSLKWFDLQRYFAEKKGPLPIVSPGTVIFIPFRAFGVSQRGSIQIFGDVTRPGIRKGKNVKNFTELMDLAGGPKSSADLRKVLTVYKGSNFTISQTVNVQRAFRTGRMDRLPPTPRGDIVVHIQTLQLEDLTVKRSQDLLQLIISGITVVTSITGIIILFTAVGK